MDSRKVWFVVDKRYIDKRPIVETVLYLRGRTSPSAAWFTFLKAYNPTLDLNDDDKRKEAMMEHKAEGYVAKAFNVTVEPA